MTKAIRRTLLGLVALLGCISVFVSAAPHAEAINYSWGCWNWVSGDRCPQGAKHHYNFMSSNTSPSSANLCAFISSNADTSGYINGSGCAPGTYYSFCHGIVANEYHAIGEHFNDANTRSLSETAISGYGCPSSRTASLSATASSSESPLIRDAIAARPELGIAPSAAERVAPHVTDVPASLGRCAYLQLPDAAAFACTDTSRADVVQSTTMTDDGWVVWGATSDAVDHVTARFADGSSLSIPRKGPRVRTGARLLAGERQRQLS